MFIPKGTVLKCVEGGGWPSVKTGVSYTLTRDFDGTSSDIIHIANAGGLFARRFDTSAFEGTSAPVAADFVPTGASIENAAPSHVDSATYRDKPKLAMSHVVNGLIVAAAPKSHRFIVSANYRDRKSPWKWLVRNEHQCPEEALAYKRVVLDGVVVQASGAYETGFGCRVVMYADAAACYEVEVPPLVDMTFDGRSGFYVASKGSGSGNIDNLTHVELEPDGNILARIV